MNHSSTTDSHGYTSDYDLNLQYPTLEWNTLDKLLEWQRNQPYFSSPEPLISDQDRSHQPTKIPPPSSLTGEYPIPDHQSNRAILTSNFELSSSDASRIPWTRMSAGSTSPSVVSPPQSMPDEFPFYGEELDASTMTMEPWSVMAQRDDPGPQMPKIGRPRTTPVVEEVGSVTAGGGKAPGQARRRSQNREAQRAFRARQRQYIEELARENKELSSKNKELEERCEMLARGYEKALAANTRMGRIGNAVLDDRNLMRSSGEAERVGNGSVTELFGMPWNLVGQAVRKER